MDNIAYNRLSGDREEPLPCTSKDPMDELHIQNLAITSDHLHQTSDCHDIISSKSTMEAPGQLTDLGEGENQHSKTGSVNDTTGHENMLHSECYHASLHVDTDMEASVTSLRKFPAEIRQMIFNEAITEPDVPRNSLMQTMPPSENLGLLEALRSEPILYQEALEIYYKKNTVEVTGGNLHKIEELSDNTLSLIKHMCISYSIPTIKARTFTLSPLLQPFDKLLLSTGTTLESLTLLFKSPISLTEACIALPYELPVLLNSFTKLDSLTIALPNDNEREDVVVPYHGTENQQCVRDFMKICREATRADAMIWIDGDHQVIKIKILPTKPPQGKGKGKGKAVARNKSERSSTGPQRGLEWIEERIGDGWVTAVCTCGHDHQEMGLHAQDEDEIDGSAVEHSEWPDDDYDEGISSANPHFDEWGVVPTPWYDIQGTNSFAASQESSPSDTLPALIDDEALPTTQANNTMAGEVTMDSDQHSAGTLASSIPSQPNLPTQSTTANPSYGSTWDCVGVGGGMDRVLGWADQAELGELDDVVTAGDWDDDDLDEGDWGDDDEL